jgi:heme-degrading monooxygenase HmoA
MLCALTVRKIKDGSFDDFRKAFMGLMEGGDPPEGWVRFNMVRGVDDPNEVVCFGFFDGSVDDLRRESGESARQEQLSAIEPFVESTGTDQLFEVVENLEVART